jgi:uncharacterized protein YcfJ
MSRFAFTSNIVPSAPFLPELRDNKDRSPQSAGQVLTVSFSSQIPLLQELTGEFDIGEAVGTLEGELVGDAVGALEGEFVGEAVGALEGEFVGDVVGTLEGELVGEAVGTLEGEFVGEAVGALEGAAVVTNMTAAPKLIDSGFAGAR